MLRNIFLNKLFILVFEFLEKCEEIYFKVYKIFVSAIFLDNVYKLDKDRTVLFFLVFFIILLFVKVVGVNEMFF